jgi:hypothetical protein
MHHGWAPIARLCDALAPAVQIEAGISATLQGHVPDDEAELPPGW